MTHSRILKDLKERGDKRQKKIAGYYEQDGFFGAVADVTVDNYKRPWKWAEKRQHPASKTAAYAWAVTDNVLRTITFPLHIASNAITVSVSAHNVNNNDENRQIAEPAIAQQENEHSTPTNNFRR